MVWGYGLSAMDPRYMDLMMSLFSIRHVDPMGLNLKN